MHTFLKRQQKSEEKKLFVTEKHFNFLLKEGRFISYHRIPNNCKKGFVDLCILPTIQFFMSHFDELKSMKR